MKYNFLLVPAFCLILTSCSQKSSDPVDFVNPNIGGISPLLETTVPLVNLPNSMMRINRLPGNYQAEQIYTESNPERERMEQALVQLG